MNNGKSMLNTLKFKGQVNKMKSKNKMKMKINRCQSLQKIPKK